jgi:hypothetical protein
MLKDKWHLSFLYPFLWKGINPNPGHIKVVKELSSSMLKDKWHLSLFFCFFLIFVSLEMDKS